MTARRSGVMVPLFSLGSSRSWGVGEFGDLVDFARWLGDAGQAFVQILPITEVPDPETSPYSASTAMALDPIFIALPGVEDFQALGGDAALTADDRAAVARLRQQPQVKYSEVRALKSRWLRRAHAHFLAHDRTHATPRARRFADFVRAQADWLADYVLFQAIRQQHERKPWWEWPAALKRCDPAALAEARSALADEIGYLEYVQWVAAEQWAAARAACHPIAVYGDVPFMISADSPDVWMRQDEFRFDATVGVPPDAFSDTGQDWGLPPWRWDVMAQNDFAWMRRRARRTAELFDGFRLDHLVGLYRTYIRPVDPEVEPFFAPPDEPTQARLGKRLVSMYAATGAEIVAEDLGTVPDFVRESLRELGVPGFKVLRWERQWKVDGEPYVDPAEYPEISVATTGTHDTEPMVVWWEGLDADERAAVLAIPSVQRHLEASTPFDALVRAVLDSPSRLVILPLQDLFGWDDRINTPAEISDDNWRWLMRWKVDRLRQIPEARDRAATLRQWTEAAGRAAAGAP